MGSSMRMIEADRCIKLSGDICQFHLMNLQLNTDQSISNNLHWTVSSPQTSFAVPMDNLILFYEEDKQRNVFNVLFF